jgi:hypothetical protein
LFGRVAPAKISIDAVSNAGNAGASIHDSAFERPLKGLYGTQKSRLCMQEYSRNFENLMGAL